MEGPCTEEGLCRPSTAPMVSMQCFSSVLLRDTFVIESFLPVSHFVSGFNYFCFNVSTEGHCFLFFVQPFSVFYLSV